MNWTALTVFIIFFIFVTVLGFYSARWRRGDLNQLNEWGLAGRRFGTVITWFLLGGDLYTAYTFIAVPALMFGAGAMGFFCCSLYHSYLPICLCRHASIVVGFPQTRLHHRFRFCAGPF